MQRSIFLTGGFVLHRVRVSTSTSLCSAWFSPSGELLDAERFDRRRRARQVRPGTPLWNALARKGPIFRPTAAEVTHQRSWTSRVNAT